MPPDTSGVYERVKARLTVRLIDLLDDSPDGVQSAGQRAALEEQLRHTIKALPEEFRGLRLSGDDERRLIQAVINDVVGFGPLDPLLADATITEIMVNGPQEIYIERDGQLERIESRFDTTAHLLTVIERMLGTVGLAVSEAEPLCDASLPNGSRINVVIPPLVLGGPVVTIRRKLRDWTLQEYAAAGALTPQAAEFLRVCVQAKVNTVISGGTSTGKTTVVGILSTCIPDQERIITIEHIAELELPGRRHWIRLVTRQPNIQGRGEIPLRVLVKNALRMRPDRIILGEARGGEALDVVQAMHSGHDGFITVLHANSAVAALERLETMMLMSGVDLPPSACRMQVASAIDLVIHLARFADGSRRVTAVSQVMGDSPHGFELEELFRFDAEGFSPEGKLSGALRYTGARPKFLAKFQLANVKIPAWLCV